MSKIKIGKDYTKKQLREILSSLLDCLELDVKIVKKLTDEVELLRAELIDLKYKNNRESIDLTVNDTQHTGLKWANKEENIDEIKDQLGSSGVRIDIGQSGISETENFKPRQYKKKVRTA